MLTLRKSLISYYYLPSRLRDTIPPSSKETWILTSQDPSPTITIKEIQITDDSPDVVLAHAGSQ